MKSITVLTPSNRDIAGLRVVSKALENQRFKDFEWIIGSPECPKGLDIDFKWIKDPEKKEGDVWIFNKLMNTMVKESSGELIVSIQDFTHFRPDALGKFWFFYTRDPKSAVSGVGNKYSDSKFNVQTWKDPRERDDQGSFYETSFDNWEGNFGSIPKSAIEEVGYFDEELDKWFGMDWYSVNYRAEKIGFTYFLDQTNKSFSVEHGRYDNWEEKNAIHGPFQERVSFYKANGYRLL